MKKSTILWLFAFLDAVVGAICLIVSVMRHGDILLFVSFVTLHITALQLIKLYNYEIERGN